MLLSRFACSHGFHVGAMSSVHIQSLECMMVTSVLRCHRTQCGEYLSKV